MIKQLNSRGPAMPENKTKTLCREKSYGKLDIRPLSKEAQAEIEVWKSEYQKEHDLRIKEVGSKGAPQEPVTAPAPTEEAQAELTEEEKLRAELELMTKAQILEFAKEAEIDMTPIANGKKPEMINFIMEQSKGE